MSILFMDIAIPFGGMVDRLSTDEVKTEWTLVVVVLLLEASTPPESLLGGEWAPNRFSRM